MEKQTEIRVDKKNLRMVLFIQNLKLLGLFLVYLVFYIIMFKRFDWSSIVVFVLIGIVMINLLARYIIYTSYKKPIILISEEKLVLNELNLFLKMKTYAIAYSEIEYWGTDIKGQPDSKTKKLYIKLKDGSEITYNLSIFQLDQDDLCRMIENMNPEVKLINYGEFEFNDNQRNI
jgi:hypothetical protein